MTWKETVLEAFDVFGPASLFLLSFTEAIIQPIPPDLLYIPLLANAMGDLPLIVWLWLTVTVASVLGALVGYWIGERWGTSLMKRFGQEKHLAKLEHLTANYGTLGIFIAAFSPIPYKVFGWMAGMGDMAKRPFIVAGLAGRGLRFGLEAVLIGLYGARALDAMMWFLDNEVLLAVLLILAGAGAWFAYRWWNNLGEQPPVREA
jgi:undecaprenyl-diphosphatase